MALPREMVPISPKFGKCGRIERAIPLRKKDDLPARYLELLIAATAAHHQWTVVTLNSRDFSRIEGIAWEEWSAVS